MFTDEGILKEGSKFENCLAFENNGVTCLLFPFKDVKIETSKLAIWRLKTHETFGGTWLSDYVPNVLGGFVNNQEQDKPDCPLIGQDGNYSDIDITPMQGQQML